MFRFLNVHGFYHGGGFFQMFPSGLEWEKGLKALCDSSHLQSQLLNDALNGA